MQPLVSVWMVTYNHEKFIAQALESVLMQKTNFNYEIVIGEDCSTDNTKCILKEFQNKFPTIINAIYQEKNVGAFRNAYEFVLPKCRGKYVACLEGDDYWTDPNKLQKQVDFLEANPQYVLTHSDYDVNYITRDKRVDGHNKTYGYRPVFNENKKEFFLDVLFSRYFVKTCTVCARAAEINHIIMSDLYLFSEKFKMSDTQLWSELSLRGKFFYQDEVMACYNSLAVSARNNPNRIDRFHFSKNSGELTLYLLKKYNYIEELKKTEKRHINYIIEQSVLLNEPDLASGLSSDYKDKLTTSHIIKLFLSRNFFTHKILWLYFFWMSKFNTINNKLSRIRTLPFAFYFNRINYSKPKSMMVFL